jgi:phosphoribosylglycinamide formyltransferase-1
VGALTDIAVLASGSGTNLQALLDAGRRPGFDGRIATVISDRPDARALERAERAGVTGTVVPWTGDREGFTSRICDAVDAAGAGLVVLAGFMRILGPEAMERFPDRILNIHPSLLPAFPGRDAVRQALDYGVEITGVTVHLVDEQVDHGPIVRQEAVRVLPGDTVEDLHARIQEAEHRIYPEVVQAMVGGRLRRQGRRVIWS